MRISDEFEAFQRKIFIKNRELAERAFDEEDYETAKRAYLAASNAAKKIGEMVIGKQSKEKWLSLSKNYLYASEKLNKGIIPVKDNPIKYTKEDIQINTLTSETNTEHGEETSYKKYIEENIITTSSVIWDDIAGLENTKKIIKESIVLSLIDGKPEAIRPWKGILLYGPPGTGKSLLAAATAGSLKATFFNVKVSQLLSKYFGESSKIISGLYDVARDKSPSIIFLDEFDSIALSRSGDISESSRRVLSTLLSELDGLKDKKTNQYILTIAATNTPWDLDTAVLSRFQKRIFVPLPDSDAVSEMIRINTLRKGLNFEGDIKLIAEKCTSKLFAGRDVSAICNEAIWNMVREQNADLSSLADKAFDEIKKFKLNVRPLNNSDFIKSFETIESAVKERDLVKYEEWAREYGG